MIQNLKSLQRVPFTIYTKQYSFNGVIYHLRQGNHSQVFSVQYNYVSEHQGHILYEINLHFRFMIIAMFFLGTYLLVLLVYLV